jgi:hypothetical protein
MKDHLVFIARKLKKIQQILLKDSVLKKDIDFTFDFVLPYSKAKNVSDIKLVFIGQDPTVRRKESRSRINYTLNLDKENSLKFYLNQVCEKLQISLEEEVYATNLYKCFFNQPPADDETILSRQFKYWADFLMEELDTFPETIIITLGEPLLRQFVHSGRRDVKYYWDYIGHTKSGGNFKYIELSNNYLQRRIYPLAHQPTWNRNKFYNIYLMDYLDFIKNTSINWNTQKI